MHKTKSRAFTLIELIIVIAIIAILAVTAFLMLTKRLAKSRDSRRVNDIGAINSALQIYISDASLLPLPDNYSGVYDTGYALARYQGNFTDNIASQLSNISKNIKDPQSGYYGYSVTYDRKQYQLRALTESAVSYQNNNIINQVYAASQTAKMQGNYAGFVVTTTGSLHSLWNVPSLFLFTGTAITSGYLFTGGNNNFLQDNKTTDNIYPLAIVDVSNLYNSSTADDSAVYTSIINTYSGTNNVTTSSGATAIVQSAAGGNSANFVSTTVTTDSYTKLLLHFDGANGSTTFTDNSSSAKTITINGSPQISATKSEFGGSSLYINGSPSYLIIADNSDFNFGVGDFTIDFWMNKTDTSIGYLFGDINVGYNLNLHRHSAGYFQFRFNGGVYPFNSTITAGTWCHVAVVRSNGVLMFFLNGVKNSTTYTDNSSITNLGGLNIGRTPSDGYNYVGYIDEFRISKGIARRTSNFVPPTSPY